MRLQFKHQKFQQDATNAVCDIFAGQPYSAFRYDRLYNEVRHLEK